MKETNTVETKINKKTVSINNFFSVNDARFLLDNFPNNGDYKSTFINMLKTKFPTLNKNDIELINDEEAKNIINAFLENTPRLKDMYENDNEPDFYKRFILNVQKQCKDATKAMKRVIETFNNDYFRRVEEVFTKTISNFCEQIEKITSNLPDTEEIEYNIARYQKLAQYGWALGNEQIDLNKINENELDINKIDITIEKAHTEQDINDLFKTLHETTSHEYLLSNAIKDYKCKNYLGCILIISSMVDRILSENFEPIKNNQRKRATGKKGVESLYKKYLVDSENYSFLEIYILEPLKIVLDNFFHDAEDFTFQSKGIINRNLISHGWYDKPVTNTDCLKFFYLLNSLQVVITYKLYN